MCAQAAACPPSFRQVSPLLGLAQRLAPQKPLPFYLVLEWKPVVPSPRAEEGCGTDTGRKPLLGSKLRFDGVTGEEAKLGPLALPSSEQ